MQDSYKKKLISLGAEALTDALLELTKTSETALDQVERMVSEPEENIQRFKKELSSIKRSQYYYKWDETEYFARKLGGLLEDLKAGVKDPDTGLELITLFYKADGKIMDQCDDSDGIIGDIFVYCAKELFIEYAKACEDKEKVAGVILKLCKDDSYGVRTGLIDGASQCLPEELIREMIRKFQEAAKYEEDEFSRRHNLTLIESLARQIKDAELYKKTRLESFAERPAAAYIDIARVYFESGDANTALSWIEKIPEGERFRRYESEHLLIDIYKELGYRDKLEKILYDIFRSHHSVETLQELLDVIGDDKRDEVVSSEVMSIISSEKLDLDDAEFLISIDKIYEAEKYIIKRAGQLDGDHYTSLIPLAKTMADAGHMLAASIIYRSLLCSILDRGYSKAYYYAVDYLKRLDRMAVMVLDWKGFEDHETFKQGIYNDHKRKRSFWGSYEDK